MIAWLSVDACGLETTLDLATDPGFFARGMTECLRTHSR
jgi:hypothetical protein